MPLSRRTLFTIPFIAYVFRRTPAQSSERTKPNDKADKKTVGGSDFRVALEAQRKEIDRLAEDIAWLARTSPPVGTIMPFAGSIVPEGWLLCNGDTLEIDMHPEYRTLADVIGKSYGSDGTNVRLPDLRSRFVLGAGKGTDPGLSKRDLGAVGGVETHTLKIGELPSHTHTVDDPGHSHIVTCEKNGDGGFQPESGNGGIISKAKTEPAKTGIKVKNTGDGKAHDNMPPFTVAHYCIKYAIK